MITGPNQTTRQRDDRSRRRQRLLRLLLGCTAGWTGTSVFAETGPAMILRRGGIALQPIDSNPHVHRSPSVVAAEPPVAAPNRGLAGVKINPFALSSVRPNPAQSASGDAVSLAGGTSVSPRPRSIESRVIASGQSASLEPLDPVSPLQIGKPMVSPVRKNPLVEAADAAREAASRPRDWETVQPIEPVEIGAMMQQAVEQNELTFSLSDDSDWANEPAGELSCEPSRESSKNQAEGLSFTLDAEALDGDNLDGQSPGETAGDTATSDATVAETDGGYQTTFADDPSAGDDLADESWDGYVPVIGAPVQPPALASDDDQSSLQPPVIDGSSPDDALESPVVQTYDLDSLLQRYHYRPPVEVDAMPRHLRLDRIVQTDDRPAPVQIVDPSDSPMIDPVIESVDGFADTQTSDGDNAQMIAADNARRVRPIRLPEGVTMTPLSVARASVRSLTLGGQLRNVHVVDDSICTAVALDGSQLKLIGTGNGVTQLVVWADTTNDAGQTRRLVRAFEITVDDHESSAAAEDSLAPLNQSLIQTFPDSDVVITHRGDRLIVTGTCPSRREAKRMLRLIRSTCPMPVSDDLKIGSRKPRSER